MLALDSGTVGKEGFEDVIKGGRFKVPLFG